VETSNYFVRFQFLLAAGVKMAVFWVVARILARGLVITLKMEAASTSETSVKFYSAMRCNNPEGSYLH
jgi:hypothetical protein